MSDCGVSIFSDNLSGLTANVTFYPCSGGTINLGDQVFPFTYVTDYWYGSYDCYVPTYAYNYILSVPCPSATPSSTPTPTPTDTPANTPTNTETSTPTPTNSETPTETPTNTPTNTITSTETPTNTPTNTETTTPTNTPTNTETPTNTPTPTPTVTINLTPTPTPTNARIAFTVYSGTTHDSACGQYNSSVIIYGNNPQFDYCTQFWNVLNGDSTVDMSGFYNNGQIVVELNSDGIEISSYSLCVTLTPTPTNTETPTNTPTQTPTNTETPTETPTPTNTETPTETPTNTPTNTETPTNTPTNTETPTQTITQTQTPTVTSSHTPTPTPTKLRFQFLVFSGSNFVDSCAELYNAVIYGDSPSFTSNTQFYNNIRGTVSINMTGFYSLNSTVTQLNSGGSQVGSYFSCI